MDGKIVHINDHLHIGKILGDDGVIYYLHHSKLANMKFYDLYIPMRVTFSIVTTDDPEKNHSAIAVRKLESFNQEVEVAKNPFLPDKPVNDPYKFAGRRAKLIEGISHLVNNKSILISGERGIGKSSFANQLIYTAVGDKTFEYKYDIHKTQELDYKPVNIKISKDETISSLSEKIINEFVSKYSLESNINVNHEFNLNLYKASISHTLSGVDDSKVGSLFNYDIAKIFDKIAGKCGLLIFIDELENINPDIEFALFIKNTTEYMNFEKKNLLFIVAGIPSASTLQFRNHKSFIRLFLPIDLDILSPSESYEFLEIYLRDTKKRVLDHIKEQISRLSTGLPLNLQLIGFYCYQIDMDNIIKKDDLSNTIAYLIKHIKKIEFQNKHEDIDFGFPENLLKYIIKNKLQKNIRVDELNYEMKNTSPKEINETLEHFCKNELLTKHSKGRFYIKDYLFVEYLKEYYKN